MGVLGAFNFGGILNGHSSLHVFDFSSHLTDHAPCATEGDEDIREQPAVYALLLTQLPSLCHQDEEIHKGDKEADAVVAERLSQTFCDSSNCNTRGEEGYDAHPAVAETAHETLLEFRHGLDVPSNVFKNVL